MVVFACKYPTFKIWLNNSEIQISEGKYPDNWIWEIYIHENQISIGVGKTVDFSLTLAKNARFSIEFRGKQGSWTEYESYGEKDKKKIENPIEYYEFGFKEGNWFIQNVDLECY